MVNRFCYEQGFWIQSYPSLTGPVGPAFVIQDVTAHWKRFFCSSFHCSTFFLHKSTRLLIGTSCHFHGFGSGLPKVVTVWRSWNNRITRSFLRDDISSLTPVHLGGCCFFFRFAKNLCPLWDVGNQIGLSKMGWEDWIRFCIDFQPALQVQRRGSSQPNLTCWRKTSCTNMHRLVLLRISAVTHLQQSQVQRLCLSDFFVEVWISHSYKQSNFLTSPHIWIA